MAKKIVDRPRPLIPMNPTLEQLRQAAKELQSLQSLAHWHANRLWWWGCVSNAYMN
jgi:hypothetical protein